MAMPPGMTAFNVDRSDIERERRMNNWIRSYSLPTMQRIAVQDAMVANPWGMQNAASQMELYNADATDLFGKTSKAYESAMQRFAMENAPKPREQRATPTAASGGNVVTQGEINGRQVAVPTAGNYANGAYSAVLNQLGLNESPDFSAYQQAVANYVSPEMRQQTRLQELRNEGFANKARIETDGRLQVAEIKAREVAQKEAFKAKRSEDKLRQQLMAKGQEMSLKAAKGYQSYTNSINAHNSDIMKQAMKIQASSDMLPNEKQAALASLERQKLPLVDMATWASKNNVPLVESPGIADSLRGMMSGANPMGAKPATQAPKAAAAKPVSQAPTPVTPPVDRVDAYLDGELRQGRDINDVLRQIQASYGTELAQEMAVRYKERYMSRINNTTRGMGNKGV